MWSARAAWRAPGPAADSGGTASRRLNPGHGEESREPGVTVRIGSTAPVPCRGFRQGRECGCSNRISEVAISRACNVASVRRSAAAGWRLDLTLFRLPTFSGGSVAAFGLSASIFSMILYLVLYLQDILGYSPLATGVRVMFLCAVAIGEPITLCDRRQVWIRQRCHHGPLRRRHGRAES
jgi:hypothetical protein